MTEAAPDGQDEAFRGATANLRETAKWLIGGLVTTAVAVLAGSPLTGFGALEVGWRLWVAVGGALAAYLLLGRLLWLALQVVVADSITIAQLAEAERRGEAAPKRIAGRLRPRLPAGATTFREVTDRHRDLRTAAERGDPGALEVYTAFAADLRALGPQVGVEYKLDRFNLLRRRLFLEMPGVILGVTAFAWAANPPPPPQVLSGVPTRTSFQLDRDEALALAPAVSPACYRPTLSGGLAGEGIVLVQLEGRTEIVTLPPGDCQPVRLARQNGRWFLAQ